MLTLEPLNDFILLEPERTSNETEGGILLPDVAIQEPNTGTVVAVGPGKMNALGERMPINLKPGDRILFNRFKTYERDEGCFIQEEDVWAVLPR